MSNWVDLLNIKQLFLFDMFRKNCVLQLQHSSDQGNAAGCFTNEWNKTLKRKCRIDLFLSFTQLISMCAKINFKVDTESQDKCDVSVSLQRRLNKLILWSFINCCKT